MSVPFGIMKAFRPSDYADEDRLTQCMRNIARLENIQRYAKLVSQGLRLFEDALPMEDDAPIPTESHEPDLEPEAVL